MPPSGAAVTGNKANGAVVWLEDSSSELQARAKQGRGPLNACTPPSCNGARCGPCKNSWVPLPGGAGRRTLVLYFREPIQISSVRIHQVRQYG